MVRVLILFLICGVAVAWVSPVSRSLRAVTCSLRNPSNDDGDIDLATRRNILGAGLTAASFMFLPSISSSRERSWAPSAWPFAPSPLPSTARTPAELSSSFTVSYDGNDPLASFGAELSGMKTIKANSAVNVTGGLDQAINQSIKKKQIDPRTHG